MTDLACGLCNDQTKRPGGGIIAGCPVHDPTAQTCGLPDCTSTCHRPPPLGPGRACAPRRCYCAQCPGWQPPDDAAALAQLDYIQHKQAMRGDGKCPRGCAHHRSRKGQR